MISTPLNLLPTVRTRSPALNYIAAGGRGDARYEDVLLIERLRYVQEGKAAQNHN